MRAIWKGTVAFGLVNVPIKVYAATEDHDIGLHQVHDKDGGRIRYQRRCDVCGRVVSWEHTDKAYEAGEQTVVLTDDDLKKLPQERSKEINVVEFVPTEQIDPIMFDRSYFLEPDSQSVKAYTLLRRTLEDSDRTAIVQFALRQKTRLGALRVRGDLLMLQSLLWDDEVREAHFEALDQSVRISAKEREMAASLVDSFATDFTPEAYTDEYQEELRKLIDAKLEHGESLDTDATFGETDDDRSGGEVIDLMEALKRSVDSNRAGSRTAQAGSKKTAPSKTGASKKSGPAKKTTPSKKPASASRKKTG